MKDLENKKILIKIDPHKPKPTLKLVEEEIYDKRISIKGKKLYTRKNKFSLDFIVKDEKLFVILYEGYKGKEKKIEYPFDELMKKDLYIPTSSFEMEISNGKPLTVINNNGEKEIYFNFEIKNVKIKDD